MDVVDKYILILQRDVDKLFLMLIEDVFLIIGRGIVVIGRVERGIFKIGEEVEIVGFVLELRKIVVIGIEMFRKVFDEVVVGDNVGCFFRGIQKNEVERGQVFVKSGIIKFYIKFKVQVYVLIKEEGGRYILFFNGYRLQFYFRIIDVIGIIILLEGVEMCMSGDNVEMIVEFIFLIVIELGFRFVICEGGRIVGVGFVIIIIE